MRSRCRSADTRKSLLEPLQTVGILVDLRVYVARRGNRIGMAHIGLNIRRFAASLRQTGCAGVTQIVKTDIPHVMFLQELPKLSPQTFRVEWQTVACRQYRTGQTAWLTLAQKLFHLRMQREGAVAGLSFQLVAAYRVAAPGFVMDSLSTMPYMQ